jgi:hypothetical protein
MPSVIATGIVTAQAAPPAPQLIPAPVTFPPVGGVIVSVYGGPIGNPPPPLAVNVALQLFAASTRTLVVRLVPLHAPPQLVNVYPVDGAAVIVAGVPLASVTAHAAPPAPHVSPFPVTVPPVGAGVIVSEYVVPPLELNVAAQARAPFNSTEVDADAPLQSPDQPVNV